MVQQFFGDWTIYINASDKWLPMLTVIGDSNHDQWEQQESQWCNRKRLSMSMRKISDYQQWYSTLIPMSTIII